MAGGGLSIWRGIVDGEGRPVAARAPQASAIIRAVAAAHDLTVGEMLSQDRRRPAAKARREAMVRLRAVTDEAGKPRYSLPQIGRLMGGRDHSTVVYALDPHKPLFRHLNAARRACRRMAGEGAR